MVKGLTFDPDEHVYRFAGNVVPGVTSVLSPITDFSKVPANVLQSASEFGKAVHLACELDDQHDLMESELDPALFPYLQAWRKFSADHKVSWDLIEASVYHQTLRYAGTLDRFGLVGGISSIVDIKSSAQLYPSVGPQLSAYQHALPEGKIAVRRLAVQLKADATYHLQEYTNPTDWAMFCSLLTVRNWCTQHKITPNLI